MGGRGPTYIYPSALRAAVRARFPSGVQDWTDPHGPQVLIVVVKALVVFIKRHVILQVYHVTYGNLAKAKWPN